jgi:hypothetical protein
VRLKRLATPLPLASETKLGELTTVGKSNSAWKSSLTEVRPWSWRIPRVSIGIIRKVALCGGT